jgi:hypothetical protein
MGRPLRQQNLALNQRPPSTWNHRQRNGNLFYLFMQYSSTSPKQNRIFMHKTIRQLNYHRPSTGEVESVDTEEAAR